MGMVRHFDELKIYRQGFNVAMEIFELSKQWPAEERYSLIDQIRRSSRSVCANIAEAWQKRRYTNHFISKLSDAASEAAETENWLKFAHACGYITLDQRDVLISALENILRGIVGMINHAESWCGPSNTVQESVSDYLTEASDN